ncbi:MAG: Epoxyqueuosine reductase [Candidatus Methanofastidiosum methylothiophilum]|uniref:Epoxyqueuosine reductase n=1 Tax=Candidatus Methanofastidiosum methylothiophilum TaxID=1705564 RepID=A0A150ILM6_9EURY|nr:MAG: Epoxyqueuosine reductase [Candidatus Methanofastidiosum methylthiophilus]KYC48185.1 MAG: Epoxyqueuosine reductase [Candidatus Methanofastidiosum methylthiophilus]KYC50840.1 MAG: Epoxyqueuosine reductase [Candidatus Methanofastidiosum methylthiophilus]
MQKVANSSEIDSILTCELIEKAYEYKVDTFGIADLELLSEYQTYPKDLLENYSRGISIGLKVPDEVLEWLPESRPIYAKHYVMINDRLDFIAYQITKFLESKNYKALPIPASKPLKELKWRSFLSHRAIARCAGVGWIGKSLNLITKEYGPRIRFASILTDAPLETGAPLENKCGECQKCVDKCIVGALNNVIFKEYPKNRETSLDIDKCVSKLQEFSKDPDVGVMVCGICLKVCPWGKTKK